MRLSVGFSSVGRARTALAWTLVFGGLLALPAAADAGGEGPPPVVVPPATPATPATPASGAGTEPGLPPPPRKVETTDGFLATVEDEVFTRRRIERELGPRPEGMDARAYEEAVRARLLQSALTAVVVKAAKRMGLSAAPDRVDRYVTARLDSDLAKAREEAERHKPGSGASLTLAKLLASNGWTLDQYRQERTNELMEKQYFYVLSQGAGGKRPVLDLDPAPEEIRRLYLAHRAEFDEKPAVRVALFSARVEDDFKATAATITEEQGVAAARVRLDAALAARSAGRTLAESVASGRLRAEDAFESRAGQWEPEGTRYVRDNRINQAIARWAFAPGRGRGEHQVLDTPSGTLVGVVLLDTRPARARAYDEVQDDVAGRIVETRMMRFRCAHMLELLSRATVSPPGILSDLIEEQRRMQRSIDENPVRRDVKLR